MVQINDSNMIGRAMVPLAAPAVPVPDELLAPLAKQSEAQTLTPSVNPVPIPSAVFIPTATEPAPVYERPAAYGDYLRNTVLEGDAAAEMSKRLMAQVQARQPLSADFSAGQFLNHIGALSAETNSYQNEARHTLVPTAANPAKFHPNFSTGVGKLQQSLTLSIKTREGDSVMISLARTADDNNESVAFSFSVDGKLSEAEQQAIDQLAQKMGRVADDFFRTGAMTLKGLNDVNTEQVTNFQLNLAKPHGDKMDTANYDFAFDPKTFAQQLSGKDVNGYQFDIGANFKNMLGQLAKGNAAVLQQYVDQLMKSTNQADVPTDSQTFFMDALTSALGESKNNALADAPQMQDASDKSLQELTSQFASGLADFTASFSSAVTHETGQYLFPESMTLKMQQTTRLVKTPTGFQFAQDALYEFNSAQLKPLSGMAAADMNGGNFSYTTIHQSATNKRVLDVSHQLVQNVTEEKTGETMEVAKHYQHFQFADQQRTENLQQAFFSLAEKIDMNFLNHRPQVLKEKLTELKSQQLFF